MALYPKLRRLLSHALEDWAEVARELFGSPEGSKGPRPLRVMRLERRRVLSADFSLVGGGLLLDGFDAADASLEISQQGDSYQFTTDEGWETLDGPLPTGIAVDSETLSVDRALLESLPNGLSVVGADSDSLSVTLGNADFSGLDGPVSLVAPSSLEQQPLALFTAPSEGVQLMVAPSGLTLGSLSVAGDLAITAFGEITDGPNTRIVVSGNATFTTRTGGNPIPAGITLADNTGDQLIVGGRVTFDGLEGASRHDIDVGSAGWTDFGLVTAIGGNIEVVEDAPTVIERIDASNFTLTTAGIVTAGTGATIDVAGDASITSTGSRYQADFDSDRAVTANDYTVWAAGFGTIDATRSDGDANGDGRVDAADYTMWRDTLGAIDLGGGIDTSSIDRFEAGGDVTLVAQDGVDRYDILADSPTANRFGSLAVVGEDVVVNEEFDGAVPGTLLRGVEAATFVLNAGGGITDTPDATILVDGDATLFAAGGTITLADADDPANRFEVGGDASVGTAVALDIAVGVDPMTGQPTGSNVTFGRVGVFAPMALARVAIDGDARFFGAEAGSLEVHSAGEVTDAIDAQILVVGQASFFGAGGITLADGPAGNTLDVLGNARFEVAPNQDIDVGVNPADGTPADATATVGSLTFVAPGGVARVALDGDATLASASEAATLALRATRIEDAADATLTVTGPAELIATDAIQLADAGPINAVTIGGQLSASVGTGGAIDLGVLPGGGPLNPAVADATFTAGAIRFTATDGIARLIEDDSTRLVEASEAGTLRLVSTGQLTDDDAASLVVTGDASLEAIGGILLADGGNAAGRIEVGGHASFAADSGGIAVGIDPAASGPGVTPTAATALFGSLQLNTVVGDARVAEDDGTLLARPSRIGGNLDLSSSGQITDAPGGPEVADVEVIGDASFFAASGIVLADAPTMANRLVVDGQARFVVSPNQDIDAGVLPDGMPADAFFTSGSLGFEAADGSVRITQDSGTLLGGMSLSSRLALESGGAITDQIDADTEVTQSAELIAGDGDFDVVLGDEAARFSLGAPQLFNPSEYLAIGARNVSVQADSGVNVRTSSVDTSFRGTYFLTARGSISKVGGTDGSIRPLTAERVSLDADGAVLFSDVELTATDGELPNLQVRAGEAIDLETEIDSVATLAGRFESGVIPTSDETALSPAEVEADLADGTRPDQPLRQDSRGRIDAGLENVLIAGRFARLAERTPDAIDIGDGYSAVVRVIGDAIVGDVVDATGTVGDDATARGLVVTTTGNAYLDTTGSLEFTGEGRFDQSSDVEVVALSGGVLTAVAGTVLKIDTEEADQPAAVARTTKLRSATGVVTSLSDQSGEDTAPGPRLRLDPSTEEATAATTGLVRADSDFEQRLTVAVGSRGEDNLLVEVEWADVASVREQSDARPSVRDAFDAADVPGSNELPDLIQTPVELIEPLEASTAATGLQYQELGGEFRVVTIRHNYSPDFVPNNPAQDTLPTTVRVFNDPAINLFDQGGARDLNSASFTIAPRIITLPPAGYFLLTEPDLPAEYTVAEPSVARSEPTPAVQRTSGYEGRVAAVTTAESVEYGRIDARGEWLTEIPGETWPQVRDDAEGDFLREIREKIDEGPYSEGRYRIQIRTPRGEQVLEQWTKGDSVTDETETEATQPEQAVVPELNGRGEDGPLDLVPMVEPLPAGNESVPRPLDSNGASNATEAAFAAIAAVGVWRKRLGDEGRLRLDSDGTSYTRVSRRQRGRRTRRTE